MEVFAKLTEVNSFRLIELTKEKEILSLTLNNLTVLNNNFKKALDIPCYPVSAVKKISLLQQQLAQCREENSILHKQLFELQTELTKCKTENELLKIDIKTLGQKLFQITKDKSETDKLLQRVSQKLTKKIGENWQNPDAWKRYWASVKYYTTD